MCPKIRSYINETPPHLVFLYRTLSVVIPAPIMHHGSLSRLCSWLYCWRRYCFTFTKTLHRHLCCKVLEDGVTSFSVLDCLLITFARWWERWSVVTSEDTTRYSRGLWRRECIQCSSPWDWGSSRKVLGDLGFSRCGGCLIWCIVFEGSTPNVGDAIICPLCTVVGLCSYKGPTPGSNSSSDQPREDQAGEDYPTTTRKWTISPITMPQRLSDKFWARNSFNVLVAGEHDWLWTRFTWFDFHLFPHMKKA